MAFVRQHLKTHLGNAAGRHGKQQGGAPGDLDEAARIAGPAVVEAHGHLAAVFQVGEAGDGGKLDGRMGGGERRLVEHFAVGGQAGGGVGGDGGEAGFI